MSSPHATGFMVLHSNQLEGLRELAVQFIRNHPLPVLAPEVLLVQSNGMKHWLELALAKDLGICAATQVELPSAKLWQIYRAVLGPSNVPAHMPLDKSPLVWRIMRLLPVLLAKPSFAPLKNYLGQAEADASPMNRRAYQLAAQLADVLDGYQNYRADWLEDWANHKDTLRTQAGANASAFTTPLPAAQSWQPELWRDLLDDLAADAEVKAELQHSYSSRAKVHEAFMAKMASIPEGQRPAGVPHRIMVFGVTSLPMQTVQALAALGRVCQVLMLVQNPCQHYWGHVVESRVPLAKLAKQRQAHKAGLPVPQDDGSLSEADQYTLHTDTHPLLAAWGKHGRDYLHLLDGFDDVDQYKGQFNRVDVFVDPADTAADQGREPNMLEHLQSSLLNLAPLPDQLSNVPEDDTSIAFVQTHSAQREVEVLHDRLLAWLDADPTLKPADIMVMVPDMANFVPHIHAVFGRFDSNDPRHLPYTVADTTPRTEPLVQALDTLLQLPQLRVTRVEWQSLFEVAAVRERFGLEVHDVAQLDTWLADAGVRWGLDAPHRKPWGIAPDMADANQNSWLFGIERLLLGYATGASDDLATPWANTLPQAGVGGLDARVVDGLLQWLRHTQIALIKLRQEHTPTEWVAVLQQLVALFFKPSDEADERLIERVMAPLETWLAECQLARLDSPLPLVVVREHWMAQLQQPAMQRRFFGGGVQFATLMPMRSIPFKCVCLLGMNDGDYPRSQTPRDFDLMSDAAHAGSTPHYANVHWRAGDRSRREDDRYLFLEALLSARGKLYISWQGRRTTDHEIKPPSVLVAQLMDYLNAVWTQRNDKGEPTLACVAPLQPLQAFSPKYFTQGSGFATYADDWQRALSPSAAGQTCSSKASGSSTSASRTALADSTAAPDAAIAPTELTLQHLQRLLRQPVEVFLVDRLRLRLDQPEEAAEEEEPFSLDGLEKYKLNQRIAQAEDAQQAIDQLRLSGQLAMAGFGEAQQQLFENDRAKLREQLDVLLPKWPKHLSVQSAHWQLGQTRLSAEWANGQTMWHTNGPAHGAGQQWLQVALRPGAVTEGKKENQVARIDTLSQLWLHHLAACASGTPTTSVQIGFDAAIELKPIQAEQAQEHLQNLCDAYLEAWTQPLPVAAKTACAFVMGVYGGSKDAMGKAQAAFEGGFGKSGEYDGSPALQRVFTSFEDVEASLNHWATRLYEPMFKAAKVIHLNADHAEEADA
jgi:exodeoxyribonuclease V gamma subunit